MTSLHPELLSEDGLEERAALLERRIAREWLVYSLASGLLIGVPFFLFLLVYLVTDAGQAVLVAVAAVALALDGALTVYWVYGRVRPLQRELDSLRTAAQR